jgi:hypothetical protein
MKRNLSKPTLCLTIIFLLSAPAWAIDIEGVNVPELITQPGAQPLMLNGAGVRSKFFFSIYVGALYLPQKQNSTSDILSLSGPNMVSMNFLYDEVSKEKLTAGWSEGFEENNSTEELQKLKDRLNTFNSFFKTVVKGDVIVLDYLPEAGTRVSINNEKQGTIPGADFNRALLKVWLGEEPADSDLKEAMLGKSQG